MTAAGTKLWGELPDLAFIHAAAFDGIDDDEIATAVRVLRTATERLDHLIRKKPTHDDPGNRLPALWERVFCRACGDGVDSRALMRSGKEVTAG